MSASKEVALLIVAAERAGWTAKQARRGGHWKLRSPEGRLVVVASSPGCGRAFMNARSTLRRAGLDV